MTRRPATPVARWEGGPTGVVLAERVTRKGDLSGCELQWNDVQEPNLWTFQVRQPPSMSNCPTSETTCLLLQRSQARCTFKNQNIGLEQVLWSGHLCILLYSELYTMLCDLGCLPKKHMSMVLPIAQPGDPRGQVVFGRHSHVGHWCACAPSARTRGKHSSLYISALGVQSAQALRHEQAHALFLPTLPTHAGMILQSLP